LEEKNTTENDEVPQEVKRQWDEWVNSRKIDQLAHEIDSIKSTIRAMNARISRIHALATRKPSEEDEEPEEREESPKSRQVAQEPENLEKAVLDRFYKDFPA